VQETGQPQIKKAVFEITKKKEVGVSDLTLLSKVSNEAINENLKKRFEHGEIYVSDCEVSLCGLLGSDRLARHTLAMYWSQSIHSAIVSRSLEHSWGSH